MSRNMQSRGQYKTAYINKAASQRLSVEFKPDEETFSYTHAHHF